MLETDLKIWRVLALAIAGEHMNHKRRKQLSEALLELIIRESRNTTDKALIGIYGVLQQILNPLVFPDESTLDHTQARAFLKLFVTTCEFYLKEIYPDGVPSAVPAMASDDFDVNDIPF